jgi:lycopene beta-cyclase
VIEADIVVAGGGLAAGLVALAALERRAGATVVLVERGDRLGGNHTWSFHAAEVPRGLAAAIDALVVARWSETEVVFPGLRRVLPHAYATISSARLDEVVRARLALRPGCAVLLGEEVTHVGARAVPLAGGRAVRGRLVVDARGPAARPAERAGWQKFLGLEVELDRPHGLTRPTLMDATVPQADGYRFLYTLPLGPRRLLVEDTIYSDSPVLDEPRLRAGLLASLDGATVVREERGVLPIPLEGEGPALDVEGPLAAGYAGGWFHPTTGYSFPLAARFAWAAAAPDPARELLPLAVHTRRQARFARLLNRLLFRAAPPAERWRVLERFYRLPPATIARFYDLSLTRADQARLLCGRPPQGVSWRAALAAMEPA